MVQPQMCCDLLENIYLCGINNNEWIAATM